MTPRAETTTRSRTRTAPRKAAATAKTKDALALLKEDHRHVEELFAQFESARKPERKQQIVQTLCTELTLHTQLEEAYFYPAVRDIFYRRFDASKIESGSELESIASGLALMGRERDLTKWARGA